jgi:hypothetical protein
VTDLEKVELACAHARHALADGRLDGGARNFAVFEHAPFGAAEDGAGWELLLELPLFGIARGFGGGWTGIRPNLQRRSRRGHNDQLEGVN